MAYEQQVILAIFDDEAAADAAVAALNAWDHDVVDIKLESVGVLVLDDHGQDQGAQARTDEWGKGRGIGLVLAAIAPPALIAGAIAGGVAGHFHHKGLGMTGEDQERLAAELTDGKAAVGILAPTVDADPIAAKLKSLGGDVQAHKVSSESLEAVEAAAAAADSSAANVEHARTEAANTAPFRGLTLGLARCYLAVTR